MVIDRSAWGVRVSLSVARLLLRLGSVTPLGAATVRVLLRVPVAPAPMSTVKVKLALAPEARLPALYQAGVCVRSADVTGVQEWALVLEGSGSDTVAPLTVLGPLFFTVTV